MKKVIYYCGIIFISACASRNDKEIVSFGSLKAINAIGELIVRAESYPLQSDDTPVIGADPQLIVLDDGSYVIISRGKNPILHFASSGQYLNAIGSLGNGPGEYLDICNIQVKDNLVIVFSEPDKILYFEPSGKLIREDKEVPLGTQSFFVPEGMLSYYGFGSGKDWRVSLLENSGNETHFLPTRANVIHLTAGSPIFYEHKTAVFFTDAYNPTIYKYENGKVSPYLTFDFGRYAIRDDFYEEEDAFRSMEELLSREFALIQRYMENEDYQLVEFFIQSPSELKDIFGIKRNGKWRWVLAGDKQDSPLFHSILWMDDNALYCLVEPSKIQRENDILRDLAISHSLKETDNPVVVKLFLK